MRSSCGRQHDEPYAEIMDAGAIMDALVQKRAELDESAPAAEADFHVVVRGGQWCFKRPWRVLRIHQSRAEDRLRQAVVRGIRLQGELYGLFG